MGIKVAVVKRIQELCKQNNMTINALANASGLTPSTLYSILDSKRQDIGILVLKKICDGLDITIQEFFDNKVFKDLEQEVK